MKKILLFILLSFSILSAETYIRLNQLGFLADDYKSAVVLSTTNLGGKNFVIKSIEKGKVVYTGKVSGNKGKFGDFPYTYIIQFSGLSEKGKYRIKLDGRFSYPFYIGNADYSKVVRELMKFYKVQRCGYTEPFLHKECHIADATAVYENGVKTDKKLDLTGGWHDAGDYVKFLNTTAFTTYTMLFSYEFDKKKFGFDYNRNKIPDILEEAKVGLDWLLRCNYDKYKLISHVQNMDDHSVGWRLPENDSLTFNRPAYEGTSKNLIGIYVATMAIAYRIWKDQLNYTEYANKCLTVAENLYSVIDKVPDLEKNITGMYQDTHFYGKLALASIEMYESTKARKYLNLAKEYADSAKSDYWWSWGNVNSYADYKIAKYDRRYIQYIENNLIGFEESSGKNLFEVGAALSWGTNNTLLGISLQAVLYKKITGSKKYDRLASIQRDYILGRNQWGISFIAKIGTKYAKNFHHQISYLKHLVLPGGFAAGPIKKEILDGYKIPFKRADYLKRFQTNDSYYRDDVMDYVTNEPTITANATAIFVMGYYSK